MLTVRGGRPKESVMSKVIVDIVFMLVVLTWIAYGFIFLQAMTLGEFLIALMVNYAGTRLLLWTDLQYALLIAEYGEDSDE